MLRWALSDFGKVVYDLLSDYRFWDYGTNVIYNRHTNLKIFIGGGKFTMKVCNTDYEYVNGFSVIDKFVLWRRYRKAKNKYIDSKFKEFTEQIKKRKEKNETTGKD